MTAEQFTYWLQGYMELSEKDSPMNLTQVQILKDHLALVFKKVTPSYSGYTQGSGSFGRVDDLKTETVSGTEGQSGTC